MTKKLPVKTFNLKPRKKRSLYLGILINLALTILWLRLSTISVLGSGKYLFLILGITSAILLFPTVFSLVRLYKEGFIGLYISADGLNDISTGHSYGLVQWRDVYKIKIVDDVDFPKYKYIILKVNNPQDYIDREFIQHKKRSLTFKFQYYGSPICFSNRALDCSFDELYATILEYYDNWQLRHKEWEEAQQAQQTHS